VTHPDDFMTAQPQQRVDADAPAAPASGAAATLPIIAETLEVEKVGVPQGGYRITKRVDEHAQLVEEVLRDRRVEIERRPVGIDVAEVPSTRYEGATLIVPVVEEVLVVEKRVRLVEEIRITPLEVSRRVADTFVLRKDNVSIERLDPDTPSDSEPSLTAVPPGRQQRP
jgi:uncharacterized protein (TIGR02271 family)